ncbi:hypothetical protein DCE79_05775 [Lysinibacillus sp. 2017]|uniref:hypothetical protein n=1 Tax=unclassified Lysinibacillus TaxID=2636778 RepID=UPI000D52A126|nr:MULTISPECIES: hypothetical protein [unclassified Lysinibacillus]AWE06938.1 hypothetical protein DCE79_05775 [Lysinibacillus sp. 2017]TGN37135.1 hypothetical protein E4L99_01225 [Lysinibacillus sp. S2017]
MKKMLVSILTYLCTIIFLTLTMFDGEENIVPKVYMAALTGLIYIVFTIWMGKASAANKV